MRRFEPQKHVDPEVVAQRHKSVVDVTKRYGDGSEHLEINFTERLRKGKKAKRTTLFRTAWVQMSPSPSGQAFLAGAAGSACKMGTNPSIRIRRA